MKKQNSLIVRNCS